MATDYKQQATQQYDSTYNAKVQALKNQLAQNQQNLDQQKGGINSNYDQQVGNANLNNKLNKNNTSNAMLGRGLANSSIAVSGLAENDAKNTRIIGQIEQGRLGDLNNIDQQKALLAQNMNNTLGQMAGNREDEIRNLAMQLEDRDWDKNFKNQGLELQKQAQAYQQQYQDATLKMQQEKQKFDMGYQNEYLAMQKQQAQAEQNYKNAMLSLQREQMYNDNAYRASQSQKPDDMVSNYINTYGAILGDTKNYSTKEEKARALAGLYQQAKLYGQTNGVDMSNLLGQIQGFGSVEQNRMRDYIEARNASGNPVGGAPAGTITTSKEKKGAFNVFESMFGKKK